MFSRLFPFQPIPTRKVLGNAWKQRITAIVKVGLTRFFGLEARNRVGSTSEKAMPTCQEKPSQIGPNTPVLRKFRRQPEDEGVQSPRARRTPHCAAQRSTRRLSASLSRSRRFNRHRHHRPRDVPCTRPRDERSQGGARSPRREQQHVPGPVLLRGAREGRARGQGRQRRGDHVLAQKGEE